MSTFSILSNNSGFENILAFIKHLDLQNIWKVKMKKNILFLLQLFLLASMVIEIFELFAATMHRTWCSLFALGTGQQANIYELWLSLFQCSSGANSQCDPFLI
jgi:hypothetical protein